MGAARYEETELSLRPKRCIAYLLVARLMLILSACLHAHSPSGLRNSVNVDNSLPDYSVACRKQSIAEAILRTCCRTRNFKPPSTPGRSIPNCVYSLAIFLRITRGLGCRPLWNSQADTEGAARLPFSRFSVIITRLNQHASRVRRQTYNINADIRISLRFLRSRI